MSLFHHFLEPLLFCLILAVFSLVLVDSAGPLLISVFSFGVGVERLIEFGLHRKTTRNL